MKKRTLNDLLAAQSALLPDPLPDANGGPVFSFVRQESSVFASELFAAERHHARRLLDTDRPLLDAFLEARRVQLDLATLPQTESMCPADVAPPTYAVPDAEPAPAPR